MKESTMWWISSIVSLILSVILINLWVQMNKYMVEPTQLVNEAAAIDFLDKNWVRQNAEDTSTVSPMIKIKTGIFIQSLKFSNSNEVNLTGYIWQNYKNGQHDSLQLSEADVGFILPEQVNSGGDIEPREIYRVKDERGEVIGWYFEATLRQPFDYSRYPFDHKTVWIRMWPKNFSSNVVLIPDFDSYKATGVDDLFGIEEHIVLGEWNRMNTYFDYKLSSYDTNFGIVDYLGLEGFPELHYNFVVKRKFQNAFFVYLLPLFLVAVLLFTALLTVSQKVELTERLGFSASGFIGTSSALFFVIMLAHIQLREQFAGTGLVYIEYFYILMYIILIFINANVFLFSISPSRFFRIILYKDNIITKVTYWPVIIGSFIFITWLFL